MKNLIIKITAESVGNQEDGLTGGECPAPIKDKQLNIKNHNICITKANLGPANPKARESVFWLKKAVKWNVSESAAREMLCSNCEHYWFTKFIQECMKKYPQITPDMVDPEWVDTKDAGGFCDKYQITCTAHRTCDDWEPGGPITDKNAKESDDEYGE